MMFLSSQKAIVSSNMKFMNRSVKTGTTQNRSSLRAAVMSSYDPAGPNKRVLTDY